MTGVQDGEPRMTSRWQLHYRRCGHGGMVVVWRTEQRPQHAVGLHRSRVSAQLTASHSHSERQTHSLGTLSSKHLKLTVRNMSTPYSITVRVALKCAHSLLVKVLKNLTNGEQKEYMTEDTRSNL